MTIRQRLLIVMGLCALLLWGGGSTGTFLLILLALLLAPGYVIECVLRLPEQPLLIRLTIWGGMSMSSVVILYGWATIFRIPLTTPILAILLMSCTIWAFVTMWRRSRWQSCTGPRAHTYLVGRIGYGVILLLIFSLTLWNRFSQIESVVLPLWVDSVHHALMIRVVTEQGMAPFSLRPYLPVEQLPYHWGYHVVTAAVTQLSGLTIPQVMLWTGQLFNAFHMLTCAALALAIWRHPMAAVVAGIIVGTVSIMPSYYVSWGRYTHLTGLLLLPPLVMVWQQWLCTGNRRWLFPIALFLAGLCMIHFLVLIMAMVLMMVMGIGYALGRPTPVWLMRLVYGMGSGMLAMLMTIPWLHILLHRVVVPMIQVPGAMLTGGDYVQIHEHLLWAGENRLLIALAAVSSLWGLWRRKQATLVFLGWTIALFLLANPWTMNYVAGALGVPLLLWGLRHRRLAAVGGGVLLILLNPALITFPYYGHVTNDTVVISLFVPLSVLIAGGGSLLAKRITRLPSRWQRWGAWSSFSIALMLFTLWGNGKLRHVINPATILASAADVEAIRWIAEHTPPQARFLINSAYWYPKVDRGIDGGYWIMPLTGRWTSTPPSLFIYAPPDYAQRITRLSAQVRSYRPGLEKQLDQLIREHHITHIYLGSTQGALTVETFANRFPYERVYEHAGVTIFSVSQSVTATESLSATNVPHRPIR